MSRERSRLNRAVLFWICTFVLFELVIRTYYALDKGVDHFWLPLPDKSGAMSVVKDPELGFLLSEDEDRSGGYGQETAPLKILAIGNSNVFGHYVDHDRAFPYLLYQDLSSSGYEVYVVNAGVPGHTAQNIRAHLELEIERTDYDVVVFTAGWNDLHRAAAPSEKMMSLASPEPPSGIMGRLGLGRVADNVMRKAVPYLVPADTWNSDVLDTAMIEIERIIELARESGAKVYALDLPSGLSDDSGLAERFAVEKVVYPPVRRMSPQAYRELFQELAQKYRTTIRTENVPLLKSGLEFEVPWEEKKYLILDQCHPSPKGNRIIAQRIITRLKEDEVLP